MDINVEIIIKKIYLNKILIITMLKTNIIIILLLIKFVQDIYLYSFQNNNYYLDKDKYLLKLNYIILIEFNIYLFYI